MPRRKIPTFIYPILGFALTILAGTVLLRQEFCHAGESLGWVDALFTATSATCVTGLVVVDTGSFFNTTGQSVILALIQLGGLGIMTYTSLIFYLWRKRIAFNDRLAVSQSLLHDPKFSLGDFLKQVVLGCALLECLGAVALHLLDPEGFAPFSALFHSVSAFCNAGFSLYADSLTRWRTDWAVNAVFIALITLGGLGFIVLLECAQKLGCHWLRSGSFNSLGGSNGLSWHAHIVLKVSAGLVIGGAAFILLAEFLMHTGDYSPSEEILGSLFQSVTCRTAGFNTMDIGSMSNVSLLVMILLMFVGGAPGSCAGGVKVTTFRAIAAFCGARLKGRRQSVAGRFALDEDTMNSALTLVMIATGIVALATLILCVSETGAVPHSQTRGQFLELLFEAVSAFGTVGLSTGVTPQLSVVGKLTLTVLMFVGRLGPIVFLQVLQELHRQEKFSWPEKRLAIG
ncbi:trk system potassium uptake protein TrkH [Desulfobaculum xiamenense]|uniref:Trk system potassium uptake protein TrkH n=1 Tax=Desulfobaculum xiamenense TaxID=995050 RepID=A0A846QQ00_9BACT|nr:potassium transporter TrkG [Desulfobaculum xiamenense]NJB66769.1 trk system potassium uptake protein TrkH [Desulfobaculum xiamenense]